MSARKKPWFKQETRKLLKTVRGDLKELHEQFVNGYNAMICASIFIIEKGLQDEFRKWLKDNEAYLHLKGDD